MCVNRKGDFYMIEKIAMWGGFAGIIIALFAMVVLYLTRSNIIELLDRDVVMYDKNYEAKKDSLQEAFACLDLVAQNGVEIKNNTQYIQKAKEAYNALLCTVNSAKLYKEFYRMAVDHTTSGYTIEDIEKFKISCRKELIIKNKRRGESFTGATNGSLDSRLTSPGGQPTQRLINPQQKPPVQAKPAHPQRPQVRPQQPPKDDSNI